MNWKDTYNSRLRTPEEAVSLIQSNQRIFLTGNCSTPQTLLKALVKAAPCLENVEICQALTISSSDYVAPEMEGHIRVNSLFISSNVRKAVWEGRADFTPVLLSEFPLLFKRDILHLNAALIHISPPDSRGFCSHGIETGLTKTPAESADIIIAQVNPRMPRMHGDSLIHVSQLDAIVEVDEPLAEHAMTDEGDMSVVQEIARHIAERIPDGATMQLGIGAIPNAVLHFLMEKKDLGVHSELISDSVIDLWEAGVLTGRKKTLHPNKIVAGFLLGTRRIYEWAHDNPLIELHATEYVNNPFMIARNSKMVAINSAIEIDLTGQVCADSIGTKFYSGVGGQMDFIYGASLSEGGLPIIALPSTTTLRDGTVLSRITSMLKPGAGVVTSRNHIHYVATEYGMVDLYGRSIRQRTQALISIAHPQFRDELTQTAKKLNYL